MGLLFLHPRAEKEKSCDGRQTFMQTGGVPRGAVGSVGFPLGGELQRVSEELPLTRWEGQK